MLRHLPPLLLLSLLMACYPGASARVNLQDYTREAMGLLSDDVTCVRLVEQWEIKGSPAAVTMPNKCIIYVQDAMQQMYDRFGPGAVLGIAAHEAGHLLLHDMGTPVWIAQLEADEMAGCALARSRYRVGDYLDALESISSDPTPRIEATMRGVDRCD